MVFEGPFAKLLEGLPRLPEENEVAVLKIYQRGRKDVGLTAKSSLLTSQELLAHKLECERTQNL